MPKDPLDVDFGRDADCCIYVPEKLDQLQNGIFVPNYLAYSDVRLFSVYRDQNGRKKRMGLVMAFDTENEENELVLACNSLELSQFGIAGGKQTVREITEYVENWLVGYANEHNYSGVVMGNHSYNTSANFSSKSDEIYQGSLTLMVPDGFYSDILIFDKGPRNRFLHMMLGKKEMQTRKDGCYVLWMKSDDE